MSNASVKLLEGAALKIELKSEMPDSDWVEAGAWFKSLVNLGVQLAEATASPNFHISKILIACPKREFISAALAFGYSIQKFRSGDTLSREISLDKVPELELGQILRVERDPGKFGTDLHLQDLALASVEPPKSTVGASVTIRGRVNGDLKTFLLDPRAISTLSLLPKGFPTRLHKLPVPPAGKRSQDVPAIRWNSQASPGLVIYGEVDYFREQASTRVRYAPLQAVLGSAETSLEDIGRIDYEENKFAHFVNLFEPVNSFPKLSDWPHSLPDLCEWVVLDGNRASTKLSAKEALIDRRVLSIVEMGVPRSQGKALAAFTEQTANLRRVDASTLLAWTPPAGVQIWAWSNK